jgi:hypothetical protein
MKLFLSAGILIASSAMAFAGTSVSYEPIGYSPVEPTMSSNSDMTSALVILALIGAAVAASSISGSIATKRESDPFLLPEDE